MLIFLYGPNTYCLRQKLKEILIDYQNHFTPLEITGVRKKDKENPKGKLSASYGASKSLTGFTEGVRIRNFDFLKQRAFNENNQYCFEDFKEEINNLSLFTKRKIVILDNLLEDSESKKKFLEVAESFIKTKDIILISQPGEVDKRDRLYKFLIKKAKVYKFPEIKGLKLGKWLKAEFERQGAFISPKALEILIVLTGGDLWRLSNEVQKLISFKNQKEITSEDVKLHVKPQIETDIFRTIEAIAQKDKKQALQLLHQHLEKGDMPLYLFSMINFQFRNLLLVRDLIERQKSFNEILKQLPMHPFVIKKSYFQAKHFSLQELKKIYQKIFQLDFQIKIGKIKPEMASELFIAQT